MAKSSFSSVESSNQLGHLGESHLGQPHHKNNNFMLPITRPISFLFSFLSIHDFIFSCFRLCGWLVAMNKEQPQLMRGSLSDTETPGNPYLLANKVGGGLLLWSVCFRKTYLVSPVTAGLTLGWRTGKPRDYSLLEFALPSRDTILSLGL